MKADKYTFEIVWSDNDRKYIVRVLKNGKCVAAPREETLQDALMRVIDYKGPNPTTIKIK